MSAYKKPAAEASEYNNKFHPQKEKTPTMKSWPAFFGEEGVVAELFSPPELNIGEEDRARSIIEDMRLLCSERHIGIFVKRGKNHHLVIRYPVVCMVSSVWPDGKGALAHVKECAFPFAGLTYLFIGMANAVKPAGAFGIERDGAVWLHPARYRTLHSHFVWRFIPEQDPQMTWVCHGDVRRRKSASRRKKH